MTIGFIGLGIMGSRMAHNLRQNDVPLMVHNRSRPKADDLLNAGATWANTPAEMAASTSTVFTMLAHPDAVRSVAFGESGFLDQLAPGALWIDCTTTNPRFAREMAAAAAERNVRFLDAPVAGTKPHAANAELTFIVGGEADDLTEIRPYLEMMGNRIAHVGEVGMGISLKVVVNALLASAMATFAEAVALGRGLGLTEETLLNVLVGGPVVAPFMGMKKEMIASGEYDTQFKLSSIKKDVQMASLAAYEAGVPVPLIEATKALYQSAERQGLGDTDFSAIYQALNG